MSESRAVVCFPSWPSFLGRTHRDAAVVLEPPAVEDDHFNALLLALLRQQAANNSSCRSGLCGGLLVAILQRLTHSLGDGAEADEGEVL